MAPGPRRRTAILTITLPGVGAGEPRPQDPTREYRFELAIDGKLAGAGPFFSPFGDERWREVLSALRFATEAPDGADRAKVRAARDRVEDAGSRLTALLRASSPEAERFLADRSSPRRLVVQSPRAEIHALPWEALVDEATGGDRRVPAQDDLSIVRSGGAFDPAPEAVLSPATVRAAIGPKTAGGTLAPFNWLAAESAATDGRHLSVRVGGDPADLRGEIVSLEAHGDPGSGEVDTGVLSAAAADAVEALKDRRMVLLWSCHSGYMRPEGGAIALRLQAQGCTFVLLFATPLRFDTSARLADELVRACFDWKAPLDPETAVVRARARLYEERPRACEWASLALWLRAPVDLSALTLAGPRILPPGGEALPVAGRERLAQVIRDEALCGRIVLVPRFPLAGSFPADVVRPFRGAVVHLHANAMELAGAHPLRTALDVAPPSVHRGDVLLAILDRLAARPQSLLVWSGVGEDEVAALRLLDEVPRNVAIVLTTPGDAPPVTAAITVLDDGSAPARATGAPPVAVGSAEAALSELERVLDRGDHERAAEVWRQACTLSEELGPAQKVRLHVAGYWSLVRVNEVAEATRCAAQVEQHDRFEGALLRGNLAEREGRHDLAARAYAEAAALAADDFGRARVAVEQGWPLAQSGDLEAAERLYRRALALLEQDTGRRGDLTWGSALGRVLRDDADVLAGRRERADECAALLRRAVAVHALDGRLNQVAAVLKTRARLERTLGRPDRAERALVTASSVLRGCGNRSGWFDAVASLAELALERGDLAHAIALASSGVAQASSEHFGPVRARLSLAAARACWRSGDLGAARRWIAKVDPRAVRPTVAGFAHDLGELLVNL
jgi:tetratricopeptide (TPR) repeat protein